MKLMKDLYRIYIKEKYTVERNGTKFKLDFRVYISDFDSRCALSVVSEDPSLILFTKVTVDVENPCYNTTSLREIIDNVCDINNWRNKHIAGFNEIHKYAIETMELYLMLSEAMI